MTRRFRWISAIVIVAGLGLGAILVAGTLAATPSPATVGPPPTDLPAEQVAIDSGSGSRLSGWFVAGEPQHGAILLMHGVRANRREMLGRARLLHSAGMAVLMFDFQAHGESPGVAITFGYLEAKDARAAFDWLRRKAPTERLGVIGVSLGGAAAVLADPPLEADAMVLEAVFGTFTDAVRNRVASNLGPPGRVLAPILTPILMWQVRPRLGFDSDILQPAARIGLVHAPLLMMAGDADRYASLDETNLIYGRANAPKELWVIPGARHVDFLRYAPAEYERRLLDFLRPRLRS